jgi:acetyl-CoA synthetase
MRPEALAHSLPGGGASSVAGAELRRQSRDVVSPDLHFCTADVGWVTGHSMITYGPLLTGSHTLMFEGVPTYPDHDRLWEIVEKHRVTTLYTGAFARRPGRHALYAGLKWRVSI